MRILQLGASEVIIEHKGSKFVRARSNAAVFARRTCRSTQGAGKDVSVLNVREHKEGEGEERTSVTTREVGGLGG